ncbi:hypothetical protein CsSME_00019998 [Camellia sinensis var. sinensis]
MGYPEKPQKEESEGKKWVIAGMLLRSPLKPMFTNPVQEKDDDEDNRVFDDVNGPILRGAWTSDLEDSVQEERGRAI